MLNRFTAIAVACICVLLWCTASEGSLAASFVQTQTTATGGKFRVDATDTTGFAATSYTLDFVFDTYSLSGDRVRVDSITPLGGFNYAATAGDIFMPPSLSIASGMGGNYTANLPAATTVPINATPRPVAEVMFSIVDTLGVVTGFDAGESFKVNLLTTGITEFGEGPPNFGSVVLMSDAMGTIAVPEVSSFACVGASLFLVAGIGFCRRFKGNSGSTDCVDYVNA